jgi:hypothetical protein
MNMPEDPTSLPFREDGRPIPPVEGAWSQMEKKLDISMPPADIQHALRPWYGRFGVWAGTAAAAIVAIVLTTMLVNVPAPTAPGSPPRETPKLTNAPNTPKVPTQDQASGSNQAPSANQAPNENQPSGKDQASSGNQAPSRDQAPSGSQPAGRDLAITNRPNNAPSNSDRSSNTHSHNSHSHSIRPRDEQIATSSQPGSVVLSNSATRSIVPGSVATDRTQPAPGNAAKDRPTAKIQHNLTPAARAPLGPNLTTPIKAADSLISLAAAKHSKGPIVLTGSRSNSRYRHIPKFSAGIAFKQYLPLPGQQFNDYNSDGSKAVYSDYIPAVFVRAAINDRSYLQASFGYHSPQYTRHMILDNENLGNSTVPGYVAYLEFNQDALKKLFYNELDLTYHYQIADRWRIGAGIQYAMLSGGAIESQTILKPANAALTDTVYSTQLYSMKNHTAWYEFAHTKAEWRGVLDIEYCLTQWTLGLRYQQAVQSLYFVPSLSPGQTITNGALSIRASYALWERKRR